MKLYIVPNTGRLLPFQKPASQVRLKEGTILDRLRGQLGRHGDVVVVNGAFDRKTVTPGSIVAQDDLVLSARFIDAFRKAIPDPRKNYRCEIDGSRFPLLSQLDTAPAYRPLPLYYLGDPTNGAEEQVRITPVALHAVRDGLPPRMHTLTQLRAFFFDVYAVQVEYWFDLQTATSLYCREFVSDLIRFAGLFLPAFVLARVLAWRWLMERCNSKGKNCSIHPTAILEGCVLGDNVEVGPFAYLRSCVLADGVIVREKCSAKGSFLGEALFIQGTDIVNCYVGRESSVICPMLFNVVFGERAFISGGSGFADLKLGGGTISAHIDGRDVPSNLHFLGSAVGDDCFLGANMIFAPGRTIPSGTRILDNGLIKSVPQIEGGTFVLSGGSMLQVPDGFVGKGQA